MIAPNWIRILMVEDSPEDEALVTLSIRRGGFQPYLVRVETAEAAQRLLEQEEWDLVIGDHALPGSSGDEVLAMLRKTGLDIPFILVSGSVGEDVAVQAMRWGAQDFVLKDRLQRLAPAIERELLAAKSRGAQRDAERRESEAKARRLLEAIARARRFVVLHELATAASGILDEEVLGRLIVDRSTELLGADRGSLRWHEPSLARLVSIAGDHQPAAPPTAAPEGGLKTVLAVPVKSQDRTVGVLEVLRFGDRPFSEEDTRTLSLLANLVGPAIEAARLHGRLTASEGRLRGIYEAMACGVVVTRRDGEVIDVNRVARNLLGESGTAQLLASGSIDAITTDAARHEPAAIRWPGVELLAGNRSEPNTVSLQLAGRDPVTIFTESVRSEGYGDGVELVVTSFFDVTPLKLAQLALERSREVLARVLDNAPVILFAIDDKGRATLAEGKALTVFGLSPEAARTANVFDLFAESPEAQTAIAAGLAGKSFAGQVHLRGLDLWFDTRYEPLLDSDGKVVGLSGLATDITDQVRSESIRAESDAKSRIVAMMNHEVRTPLNSILGFAELLRTERVGTLNDKQQRYVANVESAGRHLLALVNDSLDLSRLAAGHMDLSLETLDLAPILAQAGTQVQPLAEARDLQLIVECENGIWIRADHRGLLQVLYNLLSNAFKHSPAGSAVTLSATRSGVDVRISVQDLGGGVPAEALERIFQEFVTLSSEIEGTGLGLPLSRKLAQLMGGDISVKSEVGVGSTFTVTLPAVAMTVSLKAAS